MIADTQALTDTGSIRYSFYDGHYVSKYYRADTWPAIKAEYWEFVAFLNYYLTLFPIRYDHFTRVMLEYVKAIRFYIRQPAKRNRKHYNLIYFL